MIFFFFSFLLLFIPNLTVCENLPVRPEVRGVSNDKSDVVEREIETLINGHQYNVCSSMFILPLNDYTSCARVVKLLATKACRFGGNSPGGAGNNGRRKRSDEEVLSTFGTGQIQQQVMEVMDNRENQVFSGQTNEFASTSQG